MTDNNVEIEEEEKEKDKLDKEGLLQEAIQAIVSTQPVGEKEKIPVEIVVQPDVHEKAKTNAMIVGLSTLATFGLLQLLF